MAAARVRIAVKRYQSFPKHLDRVHRVSRDASVDRIVHIGRRSRRVHTRSSRRVVVSRAVLCDLATATRGLDLQRARSAHLQDRCHSGRKSLMFHLLLPWGLQAIRRRPGEVLTGARQ